MEVAGVVLAIPGILDLCLKYGKELKFLCSALREADTEVSERVIRLDNGWLRFQHQLNFLQRTHHIMEEDHRDICAQTLRVLLSKLDFVTAMLRQLVKKESDDKVTVRKARYALKKESLDKAIDEFESWQGIADQSWYLLMRITDTQVDRALETGDTAAAIPSTLAIRSGIRPQQAPQGQTPPASSRLTFPAEEVTKMKTKPIPYSDTVLAWHTGYIPYLLNHIKCDDPRRYSTVKQDARDLVRKLQHRDPETFGLLSCKGLGTPSWTPHDSGRKTFTMVFRIPFPNNPNTDPKSLREILLTFPPPKSLSTRFEFARQLARSISYVHTFGFVHKNVRPESILLFSPSEGFTILEPAAKQSLFLLGFENFRSERAASAFIGDQDFTKDLYRHPSRQGPCPTEYYSMQHDIYSLGVCLLEIGLWRSFVRYEVNRDWRTRYSLPQGEGMLSQRCVNTDHFPALGDTKDTKGFFLGAVRDKLAQSMGTRYAEIVETCLTCLDPGNVDFGDEREFQDEDGIKVGVRYIEKVVMGLNQLYV
ncbi:hypothetical protein QBC38DRAFT_465196 [Podospora fimiseda]|uniref:Protein kinase domain-containing protein n=1 Tax=Podospora fimiseda TaxID=252190 RepID=A0AAN7H1S8_9PEZI|nr:hypothetical protein QBC38DRAFT_465196 [Podospora fimiseda]